MYEVLPLEAGEENVLHGFEDKRLGPLIYFSIVRNTVTGAFYSSSPAEINVALMNMGISFAPSAFRYPRVPQLIAPGGCLKAWRLRPRPPT